MQTAQLQENPNEAFEKWCEYRTALKTHKEKYLLELADAYWQLSRGRKVLDLEESFRLAGLNAEGLPRLGIARADQRVVTLRLLDGGAFEFSRLTDKNNVSVTNRMRRGLLSSDWGNRRFSSSWGRYTAPVPLIPPKHLPKGSLDRYHILWEVETWTPEPPRDPILLRQITSNLFVVMAQWDLTELERSIMRSTFTPNEAFARARGGEA